MTKTPQNTDQKNLTPALRTGSELTQPRIDLADDTGAQTAEYGVVILAAVGFAGLLAVILSSDTVRGLLTDLIERALTV